MVRGLLRFFVGALSQMMEHGFGPFGYRLHRKLKELGFMGGLRDERRHTAATACANTWSGWWPKRAWNGFAWKTTTTTFRNCRTRKASCTAASSPALRLSVAPLLAGDTAKVLDAFTGHEPLKRKPPETSV